MAGSSPWISEAVFLAGVPAFGYAAAFFFEAGRAAFFDIPSQLISIDTKDVIVHGVLFGALALFAFERGIKIFGRVYGDGTTYAPPVWTMLLFLALPLYVATEAMWLWVVVAVVASVEISLWLYRRKRPVPEASVTASDDRFERRRYNFAFNLILLGVVWFVCVAWTMGQRASRVTADYYVLPDSPELAVLAIYDGTLIAAPLHRGKRTVSRELRIIPSGGTITMRREKVGPLRPE
jgi:hypothetical protein